MFGDFGGVQGSACVHAKMPPACRPSMATSVSSRRRVGDEPVRGVMALRASRSLILRACEGNLILRSIAKRCVSKDGGNAWTRGHPSRRRAKSAAPPATTAKPFSNRETGAAAAGCGGVGIDHPERGANQIVDEIDLRTGQKRHRIRLATSLHLDAGFVDNRFPLPRLLIQRSGELLWCSNPCFHADGIQAGADLG
jgi:hypothetical protein